MSTQHTHTQSLTVTLEDGAALAVSVRGAGQAVLYVSGLGGAANFWNPCLGALAASHQTICLDQRGIGQSTRGTVPCTIEQLATDCFEVLDTCQVTSAVIVGHSTGGAIAQAMALMRPSRVEALVLSGTWARPNRYMQELFKLRSTLLNNNPLEYASSAAFLSYDPAWLNDNWSVYDAMLAQAPLQAATQHIIQERIQALLQFDRSAELVTLKMPALILGARDDLIVPSFLQEALAAALPQSTLKLFPHGGHFFPVSVQDDFTQTVIDWIDGQQLS